MQEGNENPHLLQCKPDISRLVGSMERYRDISGSAIYRATAMSQNPPCTGQVFQRVVSGHGAFVCLAANSARRQRISWHLSQFDVALQNRVVEFRTKAVCSKISNLKPCILRRSLSYPPFCFQQRSKLQLVKPRYIQLSGYISRNLDDGLTFFV